MSKPTSDDGVLILERLLNRRQTDGPDVAVERGGSVDLDDGDVVLVSTVLEIPMYPYLRHREVHRSRLVGLGKIVLAESYRDVARIEPANNGTRYNCNVPYMPAV